MSDAKRDSNRITSLMGVSSVDGATPLPILINPATGRVLISATIADNTSTQKVIVAKAGSTVGTRDKINFIEGSGVTLTITDNVAGDRVDVTVAATGGGTGTVTSVSVVSANGFAGTVATPTATPAITLSTTITGVIKGNGTAISAASAGTDYVAPGLATGSGLTMSTAKILGRATAATGAIEEISVTGSGSVVLATSPTLVTPVLGVASATTINKVALTAPATGSTLTILDGKTLTINKSVTLEGTDSTTMTFPATNASIARTDAAQTFTGAQTFTQVLTTVNAITASGNAATVPVTSRINNVTNNSAATLTITLTTTSAIDGQMCIVRVFDFSAAAQTITWVNTENSTVTAPTTSNGSTTLPLTIGFQYNSNTSKWRCIASA